MATTGVNSGAPKYLPHHVELKEEDELMDGDVEWKTRQSARCWVVTILAVLAGAIGLGLGYYFWGSPSDSDSNNDKATNSLLGNVEGNSFNVQGPEFLEEEGRDALNVELDPWFSEPESTESEPQLESSWKTESTDSGEFPDTQPNILLILVDDLGYQDTSFTGAEFATPNIDRLFNEGVFFDTTYAMPICTPSRSALMTGRHGFRTGLNHLRSTHPMVHSGVPEDLPILGEYLKEMGYSTHYFGRWALGHSKVSQRPLSRGYDSFNGFHTLLRLSYETAHACCIKGHEDQYGLLMDDGHYYQFFDFWDGDAADMPDPDHSYNDLYIHDKLMDKLEDVADQDEPWHIMWAPQAVHHSVIDTRPPDTDAINLAYCESTARDLLCSRMMYFDYLVGLTIQSIEDKGMWDNTLVVFTSDNGGAMLCPAGELYSSNAPFRGEKGTMYEGGIRVPLAISGGWLPESKRGTTDSDRHQLVDLTPTILDMVQFPTETIDPSHFDGNNVFEDNHNEIAIINIAPLTEVTWFLPDPITFGTAVFWGKWKYLAIDLTFYKQESEAPAEELTGLVNITVDPIAFPSVMDRYSLVRQYDECWQGVDRNGSPFGCLFDIENDPVESLNLWDDHPEVVAYIKDIIQREVFGPSYNTGLNFEQDLRAVEVNRDKSYPNWEWPVEMPEWLFSDNDTSRIVWVGPWLREDGSLDLRPPTSN